MVFGNHLLRIPNEDSLANQSEVSKCEWRNAATSYVLTLDVSGTFTHVQKCRGREPEGQFRYRDFVHLVDS